MSTDFFGERTLAPAVTPSPSTNPSLNPDPQRAAKHAHAQPQVQSQATNAYSVAAFVLSSLGLAPLAIACAHRALKEIKLYGGGGRGTAITALVVSYLIIAVSIASAILFCIELPHLITSIETSTWMKSLRGIMSLVNGASATAGGAASPTSLGNLGSLLGSATAAH